jgi:hypothetical protein
MGYLLGKMNVARGEHTAGTFYSDSAQNFFGASHAGVPSLFRDCSGIE